MYVSIYLSISLSIHIYIYMYLSLSLYIYIYIYISFPSVRSKKGGPSLFADIVPVASPAATSSAV